MTNVLSGPPLQPSFWNGLNQSLGNYLLEYIRKSKDRVYMINGETKEQLALYELAEKSCNLAIHLQSLGCKAGTNVAIYSENCLQYAITYLGIILSGATITTFNHLYTLDELNQLIGIVNPTVLFCSNRNYQNVKEVQKTNPFIRHVIILNANQSPDLDVLLFQNLIQKSSKKLIQPSYNPDAAVAVLFSSGTTGLPKGVMQSHRNILYMLLMIKLHDIFHFEGNYILCTLPMFHAFGMFVNLFCIILDLTLVFLSRYEEELYLSLIEEYKIQSIIVVPPIIVSILKNGLFKKYDVSSLKHIFSGAASLKINTEDEIVETLRLERLQQGYGMTEATFALTMKLRFSQKRGTCGSIMPGLQAKVVDLETNQALGPGEVGELCFKGPAVMKGYYNNPTATSEMIRDGWLHTGDLGYYDQDEEFFVVDRLKELIKYKAFQVAPAELEDILIKHPEVKDAGVIGLPDERAGELPKAFVVLRQNSKISAKELQQYVASKVSPQKWLRGGVTFINEIPKNPSGKILRRLLRELAAKDIACKY